MVTPPSDLSKDGISDDCGATSMCGMPAYLVTETFSQTESWKWQSIGILSEHLLATCWRG